MVPVMDGERIVGIVTPQNFSQSMGLLLIGLGECDALKAKLHLIDIGTSAW